MIFLITGANGGGKTHYSVSLIKKQLELNKDPNALLYDQWSLQYMEDEDGYLEPIVDNPKPLIRPIFSNIKGLNFDSDQIFTLRKGFDWRELPKGSMIFLDECHQHWPATGKPGPAGDPIIDELDEHRHGGYDFYLITQYPNKLVHIVRNLVSEHMHLQNISGSQNASLFTWQHSVNDPNDYSTRQSADKTLYHYDKGIFKHYKSSSVHTRKLKIPKKLVFLIGVSLALFTFVFARLSTGGTFLSDAVTGNLSQAEAVQVAAQASPAAPAPHISNVQMLSGCISSAAKCTCYDENGRIVDYEQFQCRAIMNEPLPLPMKIQKSES